MAVKHRGRLKPGEVYLIRCLLLSARYQEGRMTMRNIGDMFRVSPGIVSAIYHGKIYMYSEEDYRLFDR